jgi:hypothetical protein
LQVRKMNENERCRGEGHDADDKGELKIQNDAGEGAVR